MSTIPSATELTKELIQFDTRNPPGREVECAHHLGDLLRDSGFEVDYHEFAPNRTSLIARLKGSGKKKALCFAGHIDVVPLGTKEWSVDPFEGQIIAGRLYGRGSTDMKAGIAAFVEASLKIAQMDEKRDADLILAICAGEETGCEGSFHLGRTGALGSAGAIVIAEPTLNYPILGHRGALWLRVTTKGVAAHGSMPHVGINAIYKAATAVKKIETLQLPSLQNELLGTSTLNIGTFEGGQNLNSVPDHAEFTIDIRTVPELKHEAILENIVTSLGKEAHVERIADVGGVYSSQDDPWIKEVFDLMSNILNEPICPRGAPYFTDASALTPAYGGPPTIILGPGNMEMAHQTDEFCDVAKIEEAVSIYELLARRWYAP